MMSNMAMSAGILVHRTLKNGPEILLGHPGGPFWRTRDLGSWSVPKGLVELGGELPVTVVAEMDAVDRQGVAAGLVQLLARTE